MTRFRDRVVLVTGGGAGIGRALANAFAAEGATVVVNDVDPARAEAVAREVGGRAAPADVADTTAVRALVADVVARHGRLDAAVANAGITRFGRVLDYEPDDFDRLLAVNLRGSFFTAQAAARAMVAAGRPGRLVLLSSVTGVQAIPGLGPYGVTKAALRMMARVLAEELGPHGITANAVAPGATITERTLAEQPDYEADWAAVTPGGRTGTVDDVTAAVLFLCSDEARHVTGQTLVVDGGWTAVSPVPPGY